MLVKRRPAKKMIRRPRRRLNRRPRLLRTIRGRSGVADIASLSERHTYVSGYPDGNFRGNDMYNFLNLNLADFPRAVQVAQAYQHYRIKQVKLTLKFPYDTFTDAAGNNSKPNLYYMIDKSGSIPVNPTLELLRTLGARPLH